MTTSTPFQELLLRTGLKKEEALVYSELHQGGPQSAGRLAMKLGLKRGHTYNIINSLMSQGLLTEFAIRGVKQFSAVPPASLSSLLQSKLKALECLAADFSAALPLLEAMAGKRNSAARVQLYRGVDGMKAIYEDTLAGSHKVLYAIADFATTFPEKRSAELNRWMWAYSTRRAVKGIWYHGILNRSAQSDLAYKRRQPQKRKLKMMTHAPLGVEINIYGDAVAVTSTADDMSGIIIRDALIASSLQVVHQVLWHLLPNYRLSKE